MGHKTLKLRLGLVDAAESYTLKKKEVGVGVGGLIRMPVKFVA